VVLPLLNQGVLRLILKTPPKPAECAIWLHSLFFVLVCLAWAARAFAQEQRLSVSYFDMFTEIYCVKDIL